MIKSEIADHFYIFEHANYITAIMPKEVAIQIDKFLSKEPLYIGLEFHNKSKSHAKVSFFTERAFDIDDMLENDNVQKLLASTMYEQKKAIDEGSDV
jgi:uncharacterized protein YpiB (UPF0302 family)